MAMYSDIIKNLDFDRTKYVIVGYFFYKIREDGLYPPKTDVMQFVSGSIFHQDWRNRVIKEYGKKCALCGKDVDNGNMYVVYKGGYAKVLKERNITTIDQAIKVNALWDVKNGEIRCRTHWKHKGDTGKFIYNPNEEDRKYINDWVKAEGVEVLAERLHVSIDLLRDYCKKQGLI